MPNLSVELWSGSTQLADPMQDLAVAQDIQYSTMFPGGVFAEASFFVPKMISRWTPIRGGRRIIIRGRKLLYEGYIVSMQLQKAHGDEGILVNCIGSWGRSMMQMFKRKIWADIRIDETVWPTMTDTATYVAADRCDVDRNNRIRFTPKPNSGTWSTGHMAAVQYVMPITETVKRITFDYTLTTPASFTNWSLRTLDRTTPGTIDLIQRTTAGTSTGSKDLTLGTPVRTIEFNFYPDANYTNPPSEGTLIAEVRNLVVYSETGAINMESVAKNCVSLIGHFNSTNAYIQAAGTPLTLSPFMAEVPRSWADILSDVTEKGDGTQARWACQIYDSERAPGSSFNGLACLALMPYPLTTDYDLAIRMDEPNWSPPASITQDIDTIGNYILVGYTNQMGNKVWRTPDDNALLNDETSRNIWGRYMKVFEIGVANDTIADNYGITKKNRLKDPPWRHSGPLNIIGAIRRKNGDLLPASEIRAGMRIRIEDFLDNLSGDGLTWVITRTTYRADDDVCTINVGEALDVPVPESLPLLDLSQSYGSYTPPDGGVAEGGGTGTSQSTQQEGLPFNWYERYGKTIGLTGEAARAEWLKLDQAKRNKWKRTTWKNWMHNREKQQAAKYKSRHPEAQKKKSEKRKKK